MQNTVNVVKISLLALLNEYNTVKSYDTVYMHKDVVNSKQRKRRISLEHRNTLVTTLNKQERRSMLELDNT